jgi:histone deacetylase 1/2
MVKNFERIYGCKPKKYPSPLDKGDHPEIDTSELVDLQGIKQYQSLIGSTQWAVQLGRIDITTAVMSLSSYRIAPRQGHLDRAKRVIGYLYRMQGALIRIRTDLPDYSDLPDNKCKWDQSIYKGAREIIPDDIPEPLGPPVICTSYVDANLYHDLITGRSVTGVLHFFNKTPIDWYSKKQATVETATYGSEFVAAKTAVDQILANRIALRYLGITVKGPSILFGDNRSVVDSATIPHSRLNKRHMALAFHRVREAMASGAILFLWMPTGENPADILSKHWGYQQVQKQLQALLFTPEPSPGKSPS